MLQDRQGNVVQFGDMLAALQKDLTLFAAFSEVCPAAEPQVLMLRAICRSLAGGRMAPTEQLFKQRCATDSGGAVGAVELMRVCVCVCVCVIDPFAA